MRISQTGLSFLIQREGFVDHWYLDAIKVPTIGVGFTWRSEAFRQWWAKNRAGQAFVAGAKMTRAEALGALQFLCDEEYGPYVDRFLGGKEVPQGVYDAMVSVVFNCGPKSLEWKWAGYIKEGDYARAASALRMTAITAGGKKLQGLINRRASEAAQIMDRSGPKVDPAQTDTTLRLGSAGAAVRDLQALLVQAGYSIGNVDGVFGQATNAAILKFQREKGLVVDGVAGPNTIRELRNAVSSVKKVMEAVAAPTPAQIAPTGFLGLLVSILKALFGRR